MILRDIKIADNLMIGVQSMVIDNITEEGTYVGSPAKRISE